MFEFLDQLPSIVVFFACITPLYPMARFVFPHVRSKNAAALLHITYGLLISLIMFKSDTLYILLMIFTTYICIRFFRVSVAVCSGVFFLFLTHYIIYTRPIDWALDMTAVCMVMFQKVVSLALNLKDGRKIRESKDKTTGRKRWDVVAIDDIPSFLYYFAYCITPYSAFSDPFIEYKLFEVILSRGLRNDEDITPSDRSKALKRFMGSFIWAGFVFIMFELISYDTYKDDRYLSLPLLLRILALPCITICQACRYFPVWWQVEAGFYEFGLASVNIVPENEISNLSMWEVCTSPDNNEFIRRWNHTTHIFWKNYLFTRMMAAGLPYALSNVAVFICSMSWHGFRFIYYGMLPETIFLTYVDTLIHKKWPIKENSPKWVTWAHILWVDINMLYTTSTFFFPSFQQYYYVRSTVYFFPTVASAAFLVYFFLFPPKRADKTAETKKKE